MNAFGPPRLALDDDGRVCIPHPELLTDENLLAAINLQGAPLEPHVWREARDRGPGFLMAADYLCRATRKMEQGFYAFTR